MIKDAEHFLFERGFSKSDQKEGYIFKVEELIELLEEFDQLKQPPVVGVGEHLKCPSCGSTNKVKNVYAKPKLNKGRLYVVSVDKGEWDDWSWGIVGIYDCPLKAEEAKQIMLAKYKADKRSKDYCTKETAKSINEISVTEWKLNDIHKSPFD